MWDCQGVDGTFKRRGLEGGPEVSCSQMGKKAVSQRTLVSPGEGIVTKG